jgi:hypothetical protein
MQPPFVRYVRNTTPGGWRRVGREVAIHRTGNWCAQFACKIYP